MRISELAQRSGVPIATIKYYLREGILSPGVTRGATQADYGDEHLSRLRLIRSLADLAGLPIAQIKTVLGLIDHPDPDLFATLGQAVSALPPYVEAGAEAQHPRARAAIEHLGWTYDATYPATWQLERALAAVEEAGIPLTDERLDAYGAALRPMAQYDVGAAPGGAIDADARDPDRSAAVRYAVLGTALYEPVVVALRRLAHQDVAARSLRA
ncbi:MerR family transcriptional regulator [Humibacter soli]